MRRVLLLLAGLLLAGAGQGAFAAVYVFSDGGQLHAVGSPRCISAAREVVSYLNNISFALYAYQPHPAYYVKSCSGSFGAVGSTVPVTITVYSNGTQTDYNYTFTLSSVDEDADTQDIAGVPIQRVAVMVGCALMFGIGMRVGRV